MKTVNLSEPTRHAKIVDLSKPAPSTGERIVRGLATVALVAGSIAAGASAAHAYVKPKGK